ncbi:uncharacterized protein BP5553_09133 [Venustampulla echinocandica]|uniref:Uncharacterized protein n=1 Tax=Venustampulla echinocandica TaxID=2656787 RepID=A0A370TE09_9HELO|nr:uncharacterized protein BP5553_09133 [Venustampulla echinocandica]RDL32677.1 hypothetical protein BP5553_09133 [Venustampulla echinocandica]
MTNPQAIARVTNSTLKMRANARDTKLAHDSQDESADFAESIGVNSFIDDSSQVDDENGEGSSSDEESERGDFLENICR